MQTILSDKKFLSWSTEPGNIELAGSEGVYLYDAEGNRYIDFVMGWCVGNFGWGNKEIIAAIQNYSGPDYVYPTFTYKGWAHLAELLSDITPGNLVKCFRATGGTDSVEAALKIAMMYTGRKQFLSVDECYHGNSIGALSIGASSNKNDYPNLLSGCKKIKRPLNANTIKGIEKLLQTETIAAFILEPVLTHPGIYMPEKDFMLSVQELCRKYGTLFIMDEVATGFGRTGKIFASEHHDIEPDVICMAKALSGGYAAIGATITTEKIGKSVEGKISAYPTYGWHPLSTEAALASTHYLVNHQDEIFKNVTGLNSLFHTKISEMKFQEKIKINMVGLAISVDVGKSSYAAKIAGQCLSKGLLIESNGSNLMMFPALNMEPEVAHEGLDILDKCV